ncbi:MAG: GNAT family N-acetyltransferase [Gemmatimonadota bacterium]
MATVFFDRVGPQAIGSRLRQLSERFTEEARSVYEMYGVGLEPKWFPVFRTLADDEEGLSTSELARRIGHTHASVSQITSAMSQAGLITSARSRGDARVNVIRLSAAGRRIVPALREQCEDVGRAVDELLAESSRNLWTAIAEMESLLDRRSLFDRIKTHHRLREGEHVRLVDFRPEHAEVFRNLNLAWIEKHFVLEESDSRLLDDPMGQIIEPGGAIVMAEYDGEIAGTCALIRMDDERYELAKMAVDETVRGKGIGLALGEAALARARELGARVVFLESNTILEPAIALYRKLGFQRVFGGASPYSRCNIQMEVALDPAD